MKNYYQRKHQYNKSNYLKFNCKWNNEQKKRYRNLLKQLDGIRCKYEEYNGAECILERNNYMVDNSSKIIALFNGLPGGTKKTIKYAKQQGLDIVIINS